MHFRHAVVAICIVGANAFVRRQTSMQCYMRAKPTPPSDLTCGSKGDLTAPTPVLASSTVPTQAECRDLCWKNGSCQSFAYDPSSSKCSLYSKPLANQSSAVSYWDRSCYERYCPTCPAQGETNCEGTCTYLNSDSDNCGVCGNSCPGDQKCSNGKCVVDPSCSNNQGLEWARYPNTNNDGANNRNTDGLYSSFNPTLFKTRAPSYQGTTTSIGGFVDGQNSSIYGTDQKSAVEYYTLNHRGYLYAAENGTYTFAIDSNIDDIACLWIGKYATYQWTRDNADKCAVIGGGGASVKTNLVANTYTPIRIIFGNGQGAAVFKMSITSPSNAVLLDSTTTGNYSIVRKSCDGQAAPGFPYSFGSER